MNPQSIQIPGQTENGNKVYNMAKACLGKNLCENRAYGCAESVNDVVETAIGVPVGGGASTYLMYQCLLIAKNRFQQVETPLAGDIIISPSGYSSNGSPNGHVGIVGLHGVLSNDSFTGLFSEKYTLDSWKSYFSGQEGFPIYYFRIL